MFDRLNEKRQSFVRSEDPATLEMFHQWMWSCALFAGFFCAEIHPDPRSNQPSVGSKFGTHDLHLLD
jgi:hypothetical protein